MEKGNKVVIIGGTFDGEKGIIDSITDTYIIVNLEKGGRMKVLPQEIELVKEPIHNTITITREEFESAVAKVVKPGVYINDISDYVMITALCLSGEIVCKKLARELFGEND